MKSETITVEQHFQNRRQYTVTQKRCKLGIPTLHDGRKRSGSE
jgi:hypothetical protein